MPSGKVAPGWVLPICGLGDHHVAASPTGAGRSVGSVPMNGSTAPIMSAPPRGPAPPASCRHTMAGLCPCHDRADGGRAARGWHPPASRLGRAGCADGENRPMMRGFLSDNASGVHPEVLAALAAANEGHAPSYGADPVTAALEERVRDLFGPEAQAFPVFNGTGANVVALKALLRPWESAVATAESHMVTDESTAPQLVGGMRLVTVPAVAGKATPALL